MAAQPQTLNAGAEKLEELLRRALLHLLQGVRVVGFLPNEWHVNDMLVWETTHQWC